MQINFPRPAILLAVLTLLLVTVLLTAQPVQAALGWVGNMFPAGNEDHYMAEGGSFDIYIQVYKEDVTEPPGQGAGITCTLHWSEVNNFGGNWLNPTDTPMSYHGDVGNNDEYVVAISPAAGLYEYTAYCTDTTDDHTLWQTSGNGRLTVIPSSSEISDARALWLDAATIAWNGAAGDSYKLLYDPDGGLVPEAAGSAPCAFPLNDPCYVALAAHGTVSGYPKNPNAAGMIRLTNSLTNDQAKELLRGQTAVAGYNSGGDLIDVSGTQIQSVLDYLYVDNGAAGAADLGVTYSGDTPTVQLWAPTAKSVNLLRFETSTDTITHTHAMSLDPASGVWSVVGDSGWDRHFYLFDVEVYVPEEDAVLNNLVTDPYAVSLSTDSERSQFVNLDDPDLKPAGWDMLSKPTLNNFTDITIYEMHVRDFSINDPTVAQAHRGTYVAFTYDGDANPLSDGMDHLLKLQAAGLTHVHLLPVFDIATVPEANVPRDVWPNPTGYPRDSDQQQAVIGENRHIDGFNWGYDPYHFGTPEGSYATDPDGVPRIIEFREMVQALNQNGLRVVMDVVYNHTSASGQHDQSVLDKIVPGYYYRYDNNGVLQHSSCCPDTATEYAMMEKLMLDTLERFAVDYKIDGFRFDLMNLHTRRNMETVQSLINSIDPDIYLYGEGWTFGSAQAKGLTDCSDGWCFADKYNMTGAGIGLFNDIIRDAAHGGYNQDPLQIRRQGFINGLSYDWNGYFYHNRDQSDLHAAMNTLRSGLRASGSDWSGAGAPFAAQPHESIPYISKHDNETLFDQNVFKMPAGVSMEERVRAQNLGLSLMALSQGVPFFHMASDILRSKSLDRNSYDSGDWFNRVYWDYSQNNFGVGLPPEWDNAGRWSIMGPHLADTSLDPSQSDIEFAAAHFRELLRIRQSSSLFRLTTMAEVNNQVVFFNGDNNVDALLVMGLLNDGTPGANWETILVFFNADKFSRDFAIPGAAGFALHPIHTDGVDDDPVIVNETDFDEATGTFTIPARTTVVFVSDDPITSPVVSDINWVGAMWPLGGVSTPFDEGAAGERDIYVQVYKEGVTGSNNNSDGNQIDCYLHWGRYGETWQDAPMDFNDQFGGNANNDEYMIVLDTDGLAPGVYGFTAYCTDDSGASKRWRDGEDGLIAIIPAADPSPAPAGGVFVHLFEWSWDDIAQECGDLAAIGYTAVQVSPPQEHIQGDPWWTRYQPVSYALTSRSGGLAQFQAMIAACDAVGVDIYVDAVVNHMTGPPDANTTYDGVAGTAYRKYQYPYPEETLYGPAHFHAAAGVCPTASGEIEDYGSRRQVQYCELLGLADLNYDNPDTITNLQEYLNSLIALGVKGFRIDAAKHMFAYDLERLYAGLDDLPGGGRPYIFQEVIGAQNEPVKEYEYFYMGDATEFEATNSIGWHFSGNSGCNGALAQLGGSYGLSGDYMPHRFAQVFVNNHDNQRGHGTGSDCIVTYKDGDVHDLATVFLLAHPYGYPSVMSSYYFGDGPGDDNQGPPANPVYVDGDPVGCNDDDWVCEHRRPAIAHMVAFRAVTAGEDVTHWWDNGGDQIAFGRGDKGFVAINRESGDLTDHTFQTGMPEGVYCDIIAGGLTADGTDCTGPTVTVNAAGQIENYTLAGMSAFAIHEQGTPQLTVVSADPNLEVNESGVITARLLTADGRPAANRTIAFTLLSGEGELDTPANAITNSAGEATIGYTAPNGMTIAIIQASYEADNNEEIEALTAIYVGYRAGATHLHAGRLGDDPITLDGSLTASGQSAGDPLLVLALFDGNPQSNQPDGDEKSLFVDIYLPVPDDVDSLTVVINCAVACDGLDAVWWGNPVSGQWQQVEDAGLVFANDQATFTLNDSSSPSLAQLDGTPFVVSENQPTAIRLQAMNAAATSSPFLLILLLAVGMMTVLAVIARRRAA